MSKLFVYGVDQELSNGEIQGEFEKFGMVTDVYNTGKGYAFVTFDKKEDADSAQQCLDGQTVFGQQLKAGAYIFNGSSLILLNFFRRFFSFFFPLNFIHKIYPWFQV